MALSKEVRALDAALKQRVKAAAALAKSQRGKAVRSHERRKADLAKAETAVHKARERLALPAPQEGIV